MSNNIPTVKIHDPDKVGDFKVIDRSTLTEADVLFDQPLLVDSIEPDVLFDQPLLEPSYEPVRSIKIKK